MTIVDPFAWTEEMNHWDYEPVTEAWFEFTCNENENTKKQIAELLKSIVGKKDPHKIKSHMNDKRHLWGLNTTKANYRAEAWVDQYETCRKFIKVEHNDSFERMREWLDSYAHAVVELACMTERDNPGFGFPKGKSSLSLGVLHYANVLQYALLCASGAKYVTWMYAKKKRIPYKFVINPTSKEELAAIKKVHQDLGHVAPKMLAVFLPAVIRDTSPTDRADRVKTMLGKLQLRVDTRAPGSANSSSTLIP